MTATPIEQLKREALADREAYTVHTWRFIEYRFLPACTFRTAAEAWAWVRNQMDLGKDMSRFRVIATPVAACAAVEGRAIGAGEVV